MRVSVVGAESSGTKLTARLLTDAGADVQHRSFPYGHAEVEERRWPEREVEDFWPHALVHVTRDWWATAASQLDHGYVTDPQEALTNIRGATLRIARLVELLQVPYCQVSYESLVARPRVVVRNLCRSLKLKPPRIGEEIVDGNTRHLGAA